MTTKIIFFPVDNGDMVLLKLDNGQTLLIDSNIRMSADDANEDTPDVASMLKEHLSKDDQGRLYVDTFLLSHPDEDHCRGLTRHFHLGKPEQYNPEEEKIFIHELWSSPIIFRRKSKSVTLCDDAQAFKDEAKRRVKHFKDGYEANSGNRIKILGEDERGKTDGLDEILVNIDETIETINGEKCPSFAAHLLGPLPKSEDEDEEEALAKNRSSVILAIELSVKGQESGFRFLTGGDAEVAVWERLWQKYKDNPEVLEYDILLAPHHCSWHTLSHDSIKEKGDDARASEDALSALSKARQGAQIIASSKPISADDADPPSSRAKDEYIRILGGNKKGFKCLGEYPNTKKPDQMPIEITKSGPQIQHPSMTYPSIITSKVAKQPVRHG